MMRVDAHQHFWRLARGDYAWLQGDDPALASLRRDFEPADLQPALQAAGIDRTVLVQAADSVAETEFMLALAGRHDFIAGVVGWVDLSQPASVATLEAWARHPKFKGVRPMLQDLPDVRWIEHGPHPEVLRALVRLCLRFDALVQPAHLPALQRFVDAWPELPVVIDHAAKPDLAAGWSSPGIAAWRQALRGLAAQPRIHCKFSGLLTQLSPAQRATPAARRDAVQPVWDLLLEAFGPARLMWGSDWPVMTLAAGYDDGLQMAGHCIGGLPPVDQAQVWGGTAQRWYGLA